MARIKKTDEKWRISSSSFTNEHAFCSAAMRQQDALRKAGISLPGIYLVEESEVSSADKSGLEKSYDFLFEYLSPNLFHQSNQLQLSETRAALRLLANFHAFFWTDADVGVDGCVDGGAESTIHDNHSSLRASLFHRGGWWRKNLRPSVRYDRIPEAFHGLCTAFPELMGSLDTDEAHRLIKILAEK